VLQLEKLIGKNYFLNLSAKEAYKAYVRAYDSHHLKQIFDVETLDLAKVAASFGFQVPPAIDLRILCCAVRISGKAELKQGRGSLQREELQFCSCHWHTDVSRSFRVTRNFC
jgi:hypothetical protein